MNHYLAPVLRQQLTLFYRFGYTFVPDALLIPFKGTIDQPQKDEVSKLLNQITPFEYDEEYVILHLQHEGEVLPGNSRFDIQQLTAIYPLSEQARVSISQKTDSRIVLGEPLFQSCLAIAEDVIVKEEVNKGIEALWNIYLEEATDKEQLLALIEQKNILHALNLRSKGKKASELSGESYWAYLLTYERYDYFPKEPVGYFFDAGQLFAFSKGRPTFEGSELHTLLTSLHTAKSNIPFKVIVDVLEKDAVKYTSQTKTGEIKLYIVAPLFLLLKDEIRNAENFTTVKDSKAFSYARDTFQQEFKAAVVLLGAFFKFKEFYDEYYNVLNLDIYQPQFTAVKPNTKLKAATAKPSSKIDNKESISTTKGTKEEVQPAVELGKEEQHLANQAENNIEVNQTSQLVANVTLTADEKEKSEQTILPAIQPENDTTTVVDTPEILQSYVTPEKAGYSVAQTKKPDGQLGLGLAELKQEDIANTSIQDSLEDAIKADSSTPPETVPDKKSNSEPTPKADKKRTEKKPRAKSAKNKQ